jgi:hypothetical protein
MLITLSMVNDQLMADSLFILHKDSQLFILDDLISQLEQHSFIFLVTKVHEISMCETTLEQGAIRCYNMTEVDSTGQILKHMPSSEVQDWFGPKRKLESKNKEVKVWNNYP